MAEPMVVDSSVVTKWFLRDTLEPDVDLADELLARCLAGRVELHAPGIISYEVCQALVKACRRRPPRLNEEKVLQCERDIFSLPITIAGASASEAMEATRMALRFSKGFYDMTYLHLAEKLDCKLCTADERAATSTDSRFPSDRIIPLSELRRT